MTTPEENIKELPPIAEKETSSPQIWEKASERRLKPFIYGVVVGSTADLAVLLIISTILIRPILSINENLVDITDFFSAAILWFIFPAGAGYYFISKGKKWFGWGVFFSIYVMVLILGLIGLAAVYIAMKLRLA